jgi:hypothetical protein
VFLDKENIHTVIQIQTRTYRIRKQLFQPNYTKDPRNKKYYNDAPGSFANPLWSSTLSPAAAIEGEEDYHHELEKTHRICQLLFTGPTTETDQGASLSKCSAFLPGPRRKMTHIMVTEEGDTNDVL